MLFPYFAYIEHFTKLTRRSFLFKEKFLLMGKIKIGRKSSVKKKKKKKKKKKRPKEKERVPICQEKKKRLVLAELSSDFEQRSRRQIKIYHT